MSVRIDPPLHDTEALLGEILKVIMPDESRCQFIVPAGEGRNYVARIRTMLSRKRKARKRRGEKTRQFTLNSTIHPETHDGKRYDAVVMWKDVTLNHEIAQAIEDRLSA